MNIFLKFYKILFAADETHHPHGQIMRIHHRIFERQPPNPLYRHISNPSIQRNSTFRVAGQGLAARCDHRAVLTDSLFFFNRK